MHNLLNIYVIQPDIIWEDIEANLNNYDHIIKDIQECDLIILPEMFATGFTMNNMIFNEKSNHMIYDWLQKTAENISGAIMGSSGIMENGIYYNRMILIDQHGKKQVYNKRHLFSPGNENLHYSKGQERVVFYLFGWKIFPQICYDLRFPVWTRNDIHYDLIINVANWPAVRDDHWTCLLKARAIENQVYVIGVNRTGKDNNKIHYLGNSCGFLYDGNVLFRLNHEDNIAHRITIDKQKLDDYRNNLNFLDDQDLFAVK